MSAIILSQSNNNQLAVPINMSGVISFLNDTFNSKELNERIRLNRQSIRASFDALVFLINQNDDELQDNLFESILAVADINYSDENGDTLLHHALRAKNIPAVCKIFQKTPNVFLLNNNNQKVWDMFVFSSAEEAISTFNIILKAAVDIPLQDVMESLFEYCATSNFYPEKTDVLTWLLMSVRAANHIADRAPYIKLLDFLFKNTKALLRWSITDFNFSMYKEEADESGVIMKRAFLNTLSNNFMDNVEKHIVITYCLEHMENRFAYIIPPSYALSPSVDFFQEGFHALDYIPDLDANTIGAIFKKFPIQDWFSSLHSPVTECYKFLYNLFDRKDISAYKRVAGVLKDTEFSSSIIESIEYSKAGRMKLGAFTTHNDNNIIQSSDNNPVFENELMDCENAPKELPDESNYGYEINQAGENSELPHIIVINEAPQSENEQNINIIDDASNTIQEDSMQIEINKHIEKEKQDNHNNRSNRFAGVKHKAYLENRYTFLANSDLPPNKRRITTSKPLDKWSCNIL